MKKSNIIISVLLFVLGALCFIFFDVAPVTILQDALANKLLCGFLSRIGLSALFIWLLWQFGGKKYLLFSKDFFRGFLWSLPCFMVAFVNFPYNAIINKTAFIDRNDLLGLYILYIVGIAIIEELIFRGVLMLLTEDLFKNYRHKYLLSALVCSLTFSLFHLTNIFYGGDIGATLLQCVYTFLIGGMLAVTIIKTKNIWLCILIHALFDFGGLLIIEVGSGNPWDLTFWILTIISGVLAAGHIIFTLIKLEKDYVSK